MKNGKGKGVSVFMKMKYIEKSWCVKEGFQIAKISLNRLNILNVYRSRNANTEDFCGKLTDFLVSNQKPLIFGDFNFCGQREKTGKISRFLLSQKFLQLVTEATQIQGRQIDHIYVKDDQRSDVLDIERYSVYYSDHDALLMTLRF